MAQVPGIDLGMIELEPCMTDACRANEPWQTSQHHAPVPLPAMGALITGLVVAIPLMAIGLLRTLFYGFVIMVHELGHAIAYWLFGYPAIPSVNLLFGGGITLP